MDRARIEYIQDQAGIRITEILDAMGVEYKESASYVHAACPVHGGDNDRAFYWIRNTKSWKCATNHCETTASTGPSSSVYGLVRGVMLRKTGKEWSFTKAVDFVARVLGLENVKLDEQTEEDAYIAKTVAEARKKAREKIIAGQTLLVDVLPKLVKDSVYYPKRGIPDDILSRYHVSYCNRPSQPFYQRAFFPVLDETGRYVQGWTARSIWEKCEKCGLHHDAKNPCPGKDEESRFVKWRHSTTLQVENCLFNIWYAKPYIAKTGVAIVTEGPGDTWGYERAGIRNSVAIMGLNISPVQRKILQRAGALTLIFTLDADKSGKDAQERLTKSLEYYFQLEFLYLSGGKDPGDMQPDDLNAQIAPVMKRLLRFKNTESYVIGGKDAERSV